MIDNFGKRLEDYKLSVSGLTSISEEAFLNWSKNYLNKRSNFNPLDFLPGKVYSFEYNDRLEKGKKFINKRPVVFFTEYDNYEKKNLFNGIDLILVPPVYRVSIFTRIQSVFADRIESNLKKIEAGNERDQAPLKVDYKTLEIILEGIPYKNAYRAWDLKKIRDVIEIPFEDWTKIVYLNTRSIEGTQINEIYNKNYKS